MLKLTAWSRGKSLVFVIIAVMAALVIGCSQPASPTATPTTSAKPAPTKEAKPEAKEAKPEAKEAKPAKAPAKQARNLPKLTVPYGAVAGSYIPIWVAKEAGLFEEYGVDVEIPYISSGKTTAQALVSGEIGVANSSGEAVITAQLAGAGLALIAATNNVFGFSLYVQPNIQKMEDLKGKTIGIVGTGGATDVAARLTVKRFGLEPDKDVAIVQMGGTPETLTAMKTGGIQGTITGPPNALTLKKMGMRELVSIADLGIPYIQTAIGVNREFAAKNQGIVRDFLRGYVAAIARSKQDKALATRVLSQYTKVTEQDVLDETYDFYVGKLLPKIPYTSLEGVQTILDFAALSNPKAREAKPETFVDGHLLKELDDSGFIKKLYGE